MVVFDSPFPTPSDLHRNAFIFHDVEAQSRPALRHARTISVRSSNNTIVEVEPSSPKLEEAEEKGEKIDNRVGSRDEKFVSPARVKGKGLTDGDQGGWCYWTK